MMKIGLGLFVLGMICLRCWRSAFIGVVDRLKSHHPTTWIDLGHPEIRLWSVSENGNANLMWFIFSRKHRILKDNLLSFKCDLVLAIFIAGPLIIFTGVIVVLLSSPIFHGINSSVHA